MSTGQDIIGNNMFAYCGNNPVNRIDANGYNWETAFKIGLAVMAIGVLAAATIATGGAAAVLAGAGIAASAASTAAAATIAAGATMAAGALVQAAVSNSTNPNYTGKTTYNDRENNERIEYEYYGNGNGNVHYELGHDKTPLWRLKDGVEFSYEIPKKIIKTIMSNPEMQRGISKGIEIVKTLAGVL